MKVFLFVVAALIVAVVIYLLPLLVKKNPKPDNNQPVLDNNLQEWIFLRALKNGKFLFRSPQGKFRSYTLEQVDKMGFATQFDFKAIQK